MATGNCISCASTLLFLRLLSAQPAGMHCTVQLSFILLINIHTVICAALCRRKPSGVLIRSQSRQTDTHRVAGAISQLGVAIFILGGGLAIVFSSAYYCESAAVAMISCQDTYNCFKQAAIEVGSVACLCWRKLLFAFFVLFRDTCSTHVASF